MAKLFLSAPEHYHPLVCGGGTPGLVGQFLYGLGTFQRPIVLEENSSCCCRRERSRQPGQEWAHWAVALSHPEVKHWMSKIFFSRICSLLPRGILGICAQADQCLGEPLGHAAPLPLQEAASVALVGPGHHTAKYFQMQDALSGVLFLVLHPC